MRFSCPSAGRLCRRAALLSTHPPHLQLGGHRASLADAHHLHNGLDQAQPAQCLHKWGGKGGWTCQAGEPSWGGVNATDTN